MESLEKRHRLQPLDDDVNSETHTAEDSTSLFDEESIQDRLRAYSEMAADTRSFFLPLGRLCQILNEASVRGLFQNNEKVKSYFQTVGSEAKSDGLDKCVFDICGTAPDLSTTGLPNTGRRKILAILVMIEKVDSIIDFIGAGLMDFDLPLKGSYDTKSKSACLERLHDVVADGEDKEDKYVSRITRFLCKGWTRKDLELFEISQSRMLPAYLRRSSDELPFTRIPNEAVLPFTESTRKSAGGYGTIYQVRIHKDQHELEPRNIPKTRTGNEYYAVKKLPFGDVGDPTVRDLTTFEKLCTRLSKRDEDLVQLLLAYRYRGCYYLVFPWAEYSLPEFWQTHPQMDTSPRNCRWVINQCVGIATGLGKIHEWAKPTYGDHPTIVNAQNRYIDIKPENILWFKSRDRLLLSDFGLSRFNVVYTSFPYDNFPLAGSPVSLTYRAPELDRGGNFYRKNDIWSLGCIFLEFLSWFLLEDTMMDFENARVSDETGAPIQEDKFFIIINDKAEVKKSVIEWMNKIRSSKRCTRLIYDFVDVIERDLLVPEVGKRRHIESVVNDLKILQQKSVEDATYCDPITVNEQSTHESPVGTGVLYPSEGDAKASVDSFHWKQIPTSGPPEVVVEVDPQPPLREDTLVSDSGYGTASYAKTELMSSVSRHNMPSIGEAVDEAVDEEDYELDRANDDTKTLYSDITSTTSTRFGFFISEMAHDLVQKLASEKIENQLVDDFVSILPGLLKALALKVGLEASSQVHRDVMVFIHRNREGIAQAFREIYMREISEEEILDDPEPRDTEPPSQLMLDRWFNEPESPTYDASTPEPVQPLDENNEFPAEDSRQEDQSEALLRQYRNLIAEEPTYEWLISRLRREAGLARASPDIMSQIGEGLRTTEAFRTSRLSRGQSAKGHRVMFSVDWDPVAFLAGQCYDKPDAEVITEVVTLTGSEADAQALSCWEYVSQTWPVTGQQTFMLIQDVLQAQGKQCQRKSQDGSVLSAALIDSKLVVEVLGIPDFAAEIAEQLAWMGAAMRPSPSDDGLVICTPSVRPANYETSPQKGKAAASSTNLHPIQWDIKFNFTPCNMSLDTSGKCWHSMFRNPVIVRGFPIPRRPQPKTGLEIPLDMMAALSGTKLIDKFNSKIFIKGFSSMLVPTQRSNGIVLWHFLHKGTRTERISYLDCSSEHAAVTLPELEASRHFVGWCLDCSLIAGARLANYTIPKSGLPETSVGCVLHKAEVSGGQFVTGTVAFSLGNREKTTHISRSHYTDKIEWISSQNVILWDELTKQGWLLDGSTALLHLLRSSLEHSKQKFKSAFLMDLDDLKYGLDPDAAGAATEFLLDDGNRELRLYRDKTEIYEEVTQEGSTSIAVPKKIVKFYLLEDRIEHLFNILEKLIDHQADVERRSGIPLQLRPRRQLEGWDFKDIASSGDPLCSRVTTLSALGKGWVDFSRQICAVTLFGKGFGDLIQPRDVSHKLCPRWSRLPTERHYLAARISDLQRIMEDNGDATSNPPRLCETLQWYVNAGAFQPCPCTTGSSTEHHDPVQVLFPMKLMKKLDQRPRATLHSLRVSQGAVIFGHNLHFHWHWADTGDPIKGGPPAEAQTSEADIAKSGSRDSGLGTSLPTTSASQSDNRLDNKSSMTSGPTSVLPSTPGPSTPIPRRSSGDRVPDDTDSALRDRRPHRSRLGKLKSYVKRKAKMG